MPPESLLTDAKLARDGPQALPLEHQSLVDVQRPRIVTYRALAGVWHQQSVLGARFSATSFARWRSSSRCLRHSRCSLPASQREVWPFSRLPPPTNSPLASPYKTSFAQYCFVVTANRFAAVPRTKC